MREKVFFGGTFNPIHHGHLICARAAGEAVGATNVVLVPTGRPGHKLADEQIAPAADRLEMCRLAIESVPGFQLDDREVRRAGPSYTIDTARQLKSEGFEKVYWIIGADMLNTLPTWHEAQNLPDEVSFIIMARPGAEFQWDKLPKNMQKLRQSVVQVPQIDISATEIRRRVRAGLSIDYFCPPAVCRFIQQRGLYR